MDKSGHDDSGVDVQEQKGEEVIAPESFVDRYANYLKNFRKTNGLGKVELLWFMDGYAEKGDTEEERFLQKEREREFTELITEEGGCTEEEWEDVYRTAEEKLLRECQDVLLREVGEEAFRQYFKEGGAAFPYVRVVLGERSPSPLKY